MILFQNHLNGQHYWRYYNKLQQEYVLVPGLPLVPLYTGLLKAKEVVVKENNNITSTGELGSYHYDPDQTDPTSPVNINEITQFYIAQHDSMGIKNKLFWYNNPYETFIKTCSFSVFICNQYLSKDIKLGYNGLNYNNYFVALENRLSDVSNQEVVKLDNNYNVLWAKKYNRGYMKRLIISEQGPNYYMYGLGQLIISNSLRPASSHVSLTKMNQSNGLITQKVEIPMEYESMPIDMTIDRNNDDIYILIADVDVTPAQVIKKYRVYKFDKNFNLLWGKRYQDLANLNLDPKRIKFIRNNNDIAKLYVLYNIPYNNAIVDACTNNIHLRPAIMEVNPYSGNPTNNQILNSATSVPSSVSKSNYDYVGEDFEFVEYKSNFGVSLNESIIVHGKVTSNCFSDEMELTAQVNLNLAPVVLHLNYSNSIYSGSILNLGGSDVDQSNQIPNILLPKMYAIGQHTDHLVWWKINKNAELPCELDLQLTTIPEGFSIEGKNEYNDYLENVVDDNLQKRTFDLIQTLNCDLVSSALAVPENNVNGSKNNYEESSICLKNNQGTLNINLTQNTQENFPFEIYNLEGKKLLSTFAISLKSELSNNFTLKNKILIIKFNNQVYKYFNYDK